MTVLSERAVRSRRLDPETARGVCNAYLVLRRISNAMTDSLERRLGAELTSNSEVGIIAQLRRGGPMRPRDLQHRIGLSSGGLSKALDRLEEQGLVARTRGARAGDGRAVLVGLTRAGRRTATVMHECVADELRIGDADVKALLHALEELGGTPAGPPTSPRYEEQGLLVALARLGVEVTDAALGFWEGHDVPADPSASLLLCALVLQSEVRPGELMEQLGLSSGGVTKLVDRLVEAGLVARTYGSVPEDRRAVVISLTSTGRRVAESGIVRLHEHCEALASVMRRVSEELELHVTP